MRNSATFARRSRCGHAEDNEDQGGAEPHPPSKLSFLVNFTSSSSEKEGTKHCTLDVQAAPTLQGQRG